MPGICRQSLLPPALRVPLAKLQHLVRIVAVGLDGLAVGQRAVLQVRPLGRGLLGRIDVGRLDPAPVMLRILRRLFQDSPASSASRMTVASIRSRPILPSQPWIVATVRQYGWLSNRQEL